MKMYASSKKHSITPELSPNTATMILANLKNHTLKFWFIQGLVIHREKSNIHVNLEEHGELLRHSLLIKKNKKFIYHKEK